MQSLFLLALLGLCAGGALATGASQEVSVDSAEVRGIVGEMAEQLNGRVNSMFHRRVGNIVRASKQLVAGTLWDVDFVWGDTTCSKSRVSSYDEVTESTCPYLPKGQVEHCHVKYWVKEWENFRQIQSFNCEKAEADSLVAYDAEQQLKTEMYTKSNSNDDHRKYAAKVQLRKIDKDEYFYNMQDFEDFVQLHGKNYTTRAEKMKRFGIFRVNMWIARQLQKFEKGSAEYGATPYVDLSLSEFRKYYLNPQWRDIGYPTEYAQIPTGDAPESFDWREHGAVSPVKNQGMCGSCWAFSTTGNIEGLWAIKKGKLLSLSEQELVDCDKLDQGCNGGLPSQAYQAIMRLGGLETETEYPYDGRNDPCNFNRSESAAYINGSVKISKDEGEMAAWLAKNGPISIGINAMPMQFYLGGIAHPWRYFCNPAHLDHGVLIVGYGTSDKGEPYWIVKNSWGASWGRQGYYYVYRGDGTCGLNTMATSAVIN